MMEGAGGQNEGLKFQKGEFFKARGESREARTVACPDKRKRKTAAKRVQAEH